MHVAHYLGLLHRSENELGEAFRQAAQGHRDEPDVFHICQRLAQQCDEHARQLEPFARRYSEEATAEPERLHRELFSGTRAGPLGLLRDLHDLYLMATECDIAWTVIGQAAQGARDTELSDVVRHGADETAAQLRWLRTRIQQAAPQAMVVAA